PAGQGAVGLAADGRVVRLRTERFADEDRGGQFLGIYVLGAGLRARLPERGGMIEDVLVPPLARGGTLPTVLFAGAWRDIGTAAAYLDANLAWLADRGAASWVGPGALVAPGVSLDRAVVGAGATVDGEGVVARCVVWPGAHARAPLADQVV